MRFSAIIPILMLLAAGAPVAGQDSALLSGGETNTLIERTIQLVESTTITIPGLVRAAAPVVEDCKQTRINLRASGLRHPGYTYRLLSSFRAYLALADAVQKPYPFPEEANRQFIELRAAVDKLEVHFRALLDDLQGRLRTPDRDNLKRYAEANTRVGKPQAGKPRTVFLGDSITDGWRLNEYFPDHDYINRGIGGQITGEMLGRMKADVIDLNPAAVVILAGTNDIARGVPVETIQNNLTMIAELAKLHSIKVIMSSVLPIHDYNKDQDPRLERSPQRPPATILQLNDWIQRYCRANGHHYLDYFSAMVDANGFLQKELADDGLHPNAAGYRIMAPLVQQAIYQVVPRAAGPRRR